METPFDDVKELPHELVSSLKKQLNNSADHQGDRVSKIFLGTLYQIIRKLIKVLIAVLHFLQEC